MRGDQNDSCTPWVVSAGGLSGVMSGAGAFRWSADRERSRAGDRERARGGGRRVREQRPPRGKIALACQPELRAGAARSAVGTRQGHGPGGQALAGA